MTMRKYSHDYYEIRVEETARFEEMYLVTVWTELTERSKFLEYARYIRDENEALRMFRFLAQRLDKAFINPEEPSDLFIDLLDDLNAAQTESCGVCLAEILKK